MADSDPIDISKLTLADLGRLAKQVADEIAKKRSEGREWLREFGSRGLVERDVRYRNPQNPAETWSGRGSQPSWVKTALAGGATLETLEMKDNLPTPSRERGGPKP